MKKYERLDRKLVYEGTIINMYKDRIKVPNGNIAEWDFIGHNGACAVIPVTDEGKIVLVKQWRNALDRFTFEIPAGGLDGVDEPMIVGAKRELEEETGYTSDNIEFLFDSIGSNAFWNTKVRCFVARDLKESKMHNDRDEETIVEYWNIYDLKEKIFKGEINDAKTISSVMAYLVKYGT